MHPRQLEVGKNMYGHAHGVSRRLIQKYQHRYRDVFLLGIDYDMERGFIRPDVDRAVFADLCVHLVTDILIFQDMGTNLTQESLKKHSESVIRILRHGVEP